MTVSLYKVIYFKFISHVQQLVINRMYRVRKKKPINFINSLKKNKLSYQSAICAKSFVKKSAFFGDK